MIYERRKFPSKARERTCTSKKKKISTEQAIFVCCRAINKIRDQEEKEEDQQQAAHEIAG